MHHFDIDALATVVAIADRGSLTSAAASLNKTQPAVSFMLARLEERLEKRLFERSRRGAALTAAGEVLTGYARRILALESEALGAVLGETSGGHIRLGVPDDYLDRFVAQPVERFTAERPSVTVEIHCDFSRNLEAMLESRTLDLAVVTRDGAHPGGELIRREEQFWCAAPDQGCEFRDPLPIAVFPEVCRARPMILAALTQAGRHWRIASSCSHLQGICAAVERGIAVTALPASTIPAKFRRLAAEDGFPELPSLELALMIPGGANPATRQLAEVMRRSFAQTAP